MKRILLIIILAFILSLLCIPTAYADAITITNGQTVTIEDNNTYTVETNATATLQMDASASALTNTTIIGESGVTLTVKNIKIDVSAKNDTCALSFTGTGNTLLLAGTNSFKSGSNEPGIRVEDTTALTIDDLSGDIGTGSLSAQGGSNGAGIGGGYSGAGGTIAISGGTITSAQGGDLGAGIGGGYYGAGGTTTISGGTITSVKGGDSGAGIGGGHGGAGGEITISGGIINTAQGGERAAGIGGGSHAAGGTIKIEGTAQIDKAIGGTGDVGYYGGAGIGGGYNAAGGTITISGGTITSAQGGRYAAGIGGGERGSGYVGGEYGAGGTITISGGTITSAQGGYCGAGIGGGHEGVGGTITISGGTIISAQGDDFGAGIGGGREGAGGTITISGGIITSAQGGRYAAGIGGGYEGAGGTVVISGGAKVFVEAGYAEAGHEAEDIGKGYNGSSSGSLEISDGSTVVFTDGSSEFSGTDLYTSNGIYFTTDGTIMSDARMIHSIDEAPWNTAGGLYCAVYSLSYNGNTNTGGTAPTDGSSPYVSGSTVTVLDNPTSPNKLTKTGYDFMGWNTENTDYSSGTHHNANDTFEITTDITLYAEWIAKEATISYNDNNGSGGESGTRTATYDSTMPTTPAITLPIRTGYDFTGYYDEASGGAQYYDNTGASARTWNKESSTYTLYAQWSAGTYDVVFNANEGSGTMPNQDIEYGQSENLDNNTFTRTHYTFNGWNTQADGSGAQYADGASYTMNTEGVTLYAQWQGKPYDVIFDANSGSGSMSNQSIVYGQSENLTANTFTYTGYEFGGWNTASNGIGTSYADKASFAMNTAGQTLYAQWNKIYTVIYDAGLGSGSTSPDAAADGVNITLHNGAGFSRDNYILEGWEISGTDYKLSELYTMPSSDVTANAIWVADRDNDGVSDADETAAGTDPNKADEKPAQETVKIHLENSDGTNASGYTFVLNSTPQEGTTDANGNVVFTNVSLSPHTLSLRSGNTEIGSYTLDFTQGNSNSASISNGGTGVSTIAASNFLSLDMTIRLGGGNLIVIVDANGRIIGIVSNPKTGE